ncbi:hypothetical protein E4T44_03223 [Aureobasidium sp. EXF-8845]|nr:hypothetical protein E4T44_03223 [Aureobasidium sp. EXF-8845]KAI4855172.1 hypothetical protein E4T45_03394 [Aureobasidium sp. EXF-8846]
MNSNLSQITKVRTLFFAPSIRDSGISLSAPTSDPRFCSPVTPPCFPVPDLPIDEEAFIQSELHFLVDELAARYACYESKDYESGVSDRCDSPTLGNFSITMASGSRLPIPTRGQKDRISSSRTRNHSSALPGASHSNSPVNFSIHNLSPSPTSNTKPTIPQPSPTINPSSPLLTLPNVFQRLAITDPNITGQPIRFLSQAYVAGANSLQVGSCTFMNLPYGAEVECALRVEPSFPRGASKQQTVMLQIVQRVVRVRDGSSVWLLCSEVDVSASFTMQVREELAAATSTHTSAGKQRQRAGDNDNNNRDEDIWTSLAQQLETNSYAPSTTRLPTARSNTKSKATTPVLSDLLSLLTEVRFLHRQFFILQPKRSRTGEVGLSIPYLSSSLHTSLLALPFKPVERQAKQKDTAHGHDTSIYTSNLDANTPLAIFVKTAASQAKSWLGMSDQTPTILREVLDLPPMGKNKDGVDEQIGVFGVRVGESWGEGRQGLGCWVCFLVPKGVEKEL